MAYDTELDFSKLAAMEENGESLETIAPTKVAVNGRSEIDLPSNGFTKYADVAKDGADLVLTAPDGSQIVIEGYFGLENPPLLLAPDGTALTEGLVNSFAKNIGEIETANKQTLNDESPIGGIKEVTGDVTVIRTDGSQITAEVGTPIYQGDQIETSGDGAANIMFVDETSFAISEDASLVIDEYVFDPSSHDGTTNFSMLRGVFMFTSGLIGKENPQNVDIDTPMGSIGIRGTVIAGDVTNGQVTIVEGAMFIQDRNGNRVDLDNVFETARFEPASGQVNNIGITTAGDLGQAFGSINTVAPDLFGVIGQSAQIIGDTSGQQQGQNQGSNQQQQQQSQQQGDDAANADGASDGDGQQAGDNADGPVEGAQEGEAGEAGDGEGQQQEGQDGEQAQDGTEGADGGDPNQQQQAEGGDGTQQGQGPAGDGTLGGADAFGDANGGFGEGGLGGDGAGGGDGTLGGAGNNAPGTGPAGAGTGTNGRANGGPNQNTNQNTNTSTNSGPDLPPPPDAINRLGGNNNSDGTAGSGDDGANAGDGDTTPASPDFILDNSIVATEGLFISGAENLGISVSVLHDFDGDGINDVALLDDNTAGDIQVLQSSTGALGTTITTPLASGAQGNVFTEIGDFNADGQLDSLFGAPSSNDGGAAGSGGVNIISGPISGALSGGDIISFSGIPAGEGVGEDIAGIGDFNGDGFSDILFGSGAADAAGNTDNGQAYLMFGGRTNFGASEDITKIDDPLLDQEYIYAGTTRIRPFDLGNDLSLVINQGSNEIRIVDFDHSSGTPTDVSGAITDASMDGPVDAITHNGFIYTFSTVSGKISIFDAIDPSNVTKVGEFNLSGDGYTNARLFFDQGNNKMVMFADDGTTADVISFDITTDPANISKVGTDLGIAGWANFTAVQFVNGTAFVAHGDQIDARPINTLNPVTALTIGTYTNAGLASGVTDIRYDSATDLVYAVSPVDGEFIIIDVSIPALPALEGSLSIAGASGVEFYKDGGQTLAFVTTDANNSVEIIDVSDPSSPTNIGSITDGATALDDVTNIYLEDGLLYVQSSSGVTTIELEKTIGETIEGASDNEFLGENVSAAGDINDDGYADFIVSSPGIDGLHIVLGNEDGLIDMTGGAIYLNAINVSSFEDEIPVFAIGDINGDGISDVAVSESGANSDLGQLRILYGGAGRTGASDGSLASQSNVTITLAADYAAGMTPGNDGIIGGGAAGNFDGDAYDDGVIAVKNGNVIDIFVLDFDAYSGNATLELDADVDNPGIYHMQYAIPAAYADVIVDFDATDFNGDGYDDLIVGFADASGVQTGESYIIYGSDYAGNVTQGSNVAASVNSEEIVGTSGNDTLTGAGYTNLSIRAGAGDDTVILDGVANNYSLVSLGSENTDASNAGAIWAQNPDRVYVGNNNQLKVFDSDFGSSTLNQIGTTTIGATNVEDIHGGGRIVYVAGGLGGIQAYETTPGGNPVQIDTDTTGTMDARGVWSDGGNVFVADSNNGLVALNFDGTTFAEIDTQAPAGGAAEDVWGDAVNDYVYLAAGDRVEAYTWDGSTLTLADSDATRDAIGVWSRGDQVFTIKDGDLHAYTFDGTTLAYVTSYGLQGDGLANSIHGDDQYIYVTTAAGTSDGMEYIRFDGTTFHSVDFVELNTRTDVFVDGPNVYTAGGGDGIEVFDAINTFSDNTDHQIDGGDGIDILRLSTNDNALDLSALGSEAISGFEEINMAGIDQVVKIGIDQIFDLLRNSDDPNGLLINGYNSVTNQFVIDNNDSGDNDVLRDGVKYLTEKAGFTEGGDVTIGATDYREFTFGGYSLHIDKVLVENGNLHVA